MRGTTIASMTEHPNKPGVTAGIHFWSGIALIPDNNQTNIQSLPTHTYENRHNATVSSPAKHQAIARHPATLVPEIV